MNGMNSSRRYETVSQQKAEGVAYTPSRLADFVAERLISEARLGQASSLRVLDPAIGDGALLVSLLKRLSALKTIIPSSIEVFGFETDPKSLEAACIRLSSCFPDVALHLEQRDFLDFVLTCETSASVEDSPSFDMIIANPPYVRTQIMGAEVAQRLAARFGLSGRVDLSHAFLIGMAQVLASRRRGGVYRVKSLYDHQKRRWGPHRSAGAIPPTPSVGFWRFKAVFCRRSACGFSVERSEKG
ncbi:hypothetical protein CCP2SC5_2620001 [Azospirillaceae bacterium]